MNKHTVISVTIHCSIASIKEWYFSNMNHPEQ